MSGQSLELITAIDKQEFAQDQNSLRGVYEKVFESILSGGFCYELSNSAAELKQFRVATRGPEGVFDLSITKVLWKMGHVEVEDKIEVVDIDTKNTVQAICLVRKGRGPWVYENNFKGEDVSKKSKEEREMFINSFLHSEVDPEETAVWFEKDKNRQRIGSGISKTAWINVNKV